MWYQTFVNILVTKFHVYMVFLAVLFFRCLLLFFIAIPDVYQRTFLHMQSR